MATKELMNKKLDWQTYGYERVGNCPPIPYYETKLGVDLEGKTWFCRTHYREQEHKFLVAFDFRTEDHPLFLRSEVVYADNYWEAHKKVYHSKFVNYKDTQNVIADFITKHNIQ